MRLRWDWIILGFVIGAVIGAAAREACAGETETAWRAGDTIVYTAGCHDAEAMIAVAEGGGTQAAVQGVGDRCFGTVRPIPARLVAWVSGPYSIGTVTASVWEIHDALGDTEFVLLIDTTGPHRSNEEAWARRPDTMALNWRGPQVTDKVRRAAIDGVNQTMGAAVVHAKRSHPWQNRTGTLEGSIDIQDYAHRTATGIAGLWGSVDVRYALIHELGGTIKAKTAKALAFEVGGQFVQVQSVTIPPRPYLRPAADAEYPQLAARIRVAYEAGA